MHCGLPRNATAAIGLRPRKQMEVLVPRTVSFRDGLRQDRTGAPTSSDSFSFQLNAMQLAASPLMASRLRLFSPRGKHAGVANGQLHRRNTLRPKLPGPKVVGLPAAVNEAFALGWFKDRPPRIPALQTCWPFDPVALVISPQWQRGRCKPRRIPASFPSEIRYQIRGTNYRLGTQRRLTP